MKGKRVTHIKGHPRYRIVQVRGENYLIDLDQQRWLIFIPFLYWFVPHTMDRIHGDVLAEIEMKPMETPKIDSTGYVLGSSAFGANLFYFLSEYLSVGFPLWVNVVLLLIVTGSVIIFRMYVSSNWEREMLQKINFKDRQTERAFILPLSLLIVLLFAFFTLLTVYMIAIGFVEVMEGLNVFYLLLYTMACLGYVMLIFMFPMLDRFGLLFLTR